MQFSTELLSLILGYIANIVVSALKKESWSDATKALVTVGVAIVFGIMATYLTGELDSLQDVGGAVAIITASAMVQYKTYFQNSALNKHLEDMDLTEILNRDSTK